MDSQKITYKHWMMLRYWHATASDEAKLLARLPMPGLSPQSLESRDVDKDVLDFTEECYYSLRDDIRNGVLQ